MILSRAAKQATPKSYNGLRVSGKRIKHKFEYEWVKRLNEHLARIAAGFGLRPAWVADPLKARARNIKCMISYSSKDCVDRVCKSLLALAEICPVVTMRLDRNFPAHDNTVDG
jgi:hypothetical protein